MPGTNSGAPPQDEGKEGEEPKTDEEILDSIRAFYERQPSLQECWVVEGPNLPAILLRLREALQGQYELGTALGVGGGGIVLRVRDVELGMMRAMKFSRPSPGKRDLLAALLASESERLVQLSHPYLMRVHTRGAYLVEGWQMAFYVMDLHTDFLTADQFVTSSGVGESDILQMLERLFEAVTYMHSKGQVHLDIKPENVLVRSGNEPVLIDFGFAKVLTDDSGTTLVGGTEGYIHPDALVFIVEAETDPNRLRGEALRRAVKPAWDLYSLGRTLLRLLRLLDERPSRPVSLYTHRYLKLLAYRLLDGHNGMQETLLGLSHRAFSELKYEGATAALLDIRKLTGSYNIETHIPELNPFQSETIQASTFSTTPFTPRVKHIFAQPEFASLGGFTQLSLLNLVFPTATHTRLEHSLGAFSAMCRYVTALSRDPINPLFRQIMREEDILAALIVALVHDIGHYSLAHDLEDADLLFSHEKRGVAMLTSESSTLRKAIERERLEDGDPGWNVKVARVLAILRANVPKMEGTVRDRIIHAMIDGPIDADKLDYIVRDSTNLGLPYGSVIDVERLLRVLTIVSRESGVHTYVNLGIHEKGRVTAEAVAFARYALYGSVYWHHAYRAVKAMLQRVALEYLAIVEASDRTKKTGVGKIVTTDLYQSLASASAKATPHLLAVSSSSTGQLHPGDVAMLEWLAERSGNGGRELVDLIQERRLFKRVLVVSRWGNEGLWRSVTTVMADERRSRKLDFQRNFQSFMLEAVEELSELPVHTNFIVADARTNFLAGGVRGNIMTLVDATRPRPGATSGLEIVQEEDRRRAKVDEAPPNRPEKSSLWPAVQESLHESLGKVRVFCHPDHSRFISALDRSVIEGALEQAVDSV